MMIVSEERDRIKRGLQKELPSEPSLGVPTPFPLRFLFRLRTLHDFFFLAVGIGFAIIQHAY